MKSERIARGLVAVSSWYFLACIVVVVIEGFVPTIQQSLNAVAPGTASYVLIKILMVITVLLFLGGWLGTIWHVAVNPNLRSAGQRAILIVVTVFMTLAATLVYYFGYLLWQSRDARAPAAA